MISEEVRQNWPLAAAMEDQNPQWITGCDVHVGQLTLHIDPAHIVAACAFLKEARHCRLSAVTGLDLYPMEPRFQVVYLLHSILNNERVRLKCALPGENPVIESVTSVWAGANWYERETFDLFGVTFTGHPGLIRIMMPDAWEGHPLRKDFPVHGHRYSYSDEGNVL